MIAIVDSAMYSMAAALTSAAMIPKCGGGGEMRGRAGRAQGFMTCTRYCGKDRTP